MKIRSVAIFEDELKELLSNPHTSSNMRNAVCLAEQILELKKNSSYALYTMALHEVCVANRVAPMADYSKAIKNFKHLIKIDPKFIGKKIGRNEPCFCGSGKKYKHCCGSL